MLTMLARKAAPAIVIAVVLGAPAAAPAALPSPGTRLIVPSSSIAGVRLGQTLAGAKAAWGRGGICVNRPGGRICYWSAASRLGSATFATLRGAVIKIGIQVGHNSHGKPSFATPLARWHTSEGIRLGSSLNAVKHAYPGLRRPRGQRFYELPGRSGRATTFTFSAGRLTKLDMGTGAV